MLVLSRKKNESIKIGEDIEVTIVDIRGDKVRLGIIAPHDVPVHRREVYDAIQREKKNVKDTSNAGRKRGLSAGEQPGVGSGGVNPTETVREVGKEEGGQSV